jgi:hypothetical protein
MELVSKNPIDLTNVKLETSSDKGLYYKVKDGRNKKIYPSLPGVVVKSNDDKVVISHANKINEDYITVYEFTGNKKVRVNQEVNESTLLGETDSNLKFNVRFHGSNYEASKFIGKKFTIDSKKRSIENRAECIARSLITLPFKPFGYHDEFCKGKKVVPTDNVEDTEDMEDLKDIDSNKEKWEFKKDFFTQDRNDKGISVESVIKRINKLIL